MTTPLRSATASVLAFAGLRPSSTHQGRSFVAVVPGICPPIDNPGLAPGMSVSPRNR
jgi:hypothetical protein